MPDRVLVLGDDVRAFLGVVRSLGRRGLEVHVAPTDLASPALASVFIAAIHVLPAYSLDAAAWEAALRQLMATFDFRMVVPCSDASLIQLQHHSAALGQQSLALPNAEAFAVFTSKERTRALARQLGVPVASGQGLGPQDRGTELTARYGLPLLLKPVASYRVGDFRDKRGVVMIRDGGQMERALADGAWSDCLVERYFPGVGIGVSVLAAKGKIVQAYQHRRLHQSTDTGVSTSRISEAVDPALLRDVERLAEAAVLDGVAMFEFRRNRSSGKHVLLEVNPRFWGSLPLAIAAGADFPAMLYEQRCGRNASSTAYKSGLIKQDLGGEYDRRVLRSEAADSLIARLYWSILALLTPLTVRRVQADCWAKDDQAPYVAERQELSERIREAFDKRVKSLLRRGPTSIEPSGHLRSA
ncbi:MAG: carboxylate--amine ligase [Allosphingosinicella sp.]